MTSSRPRPPGLRKASPLHLWVILDQAVLRRVVGSHAVMAEQIDALITAARQPTIDIQVLPWEAGAHAAGLGHFVLLRTAGALGAVYVEMLGGGHYMDTAKEVHRYSVAMDYLRTRAADITESLHLLKAAREEHKRYDGQAHT
ncbi:DUF5753 domain-containing protein [Streptomyces sp. NPDC006512]|uniref:DUF5753 domain-containing protein n=1 Tax=Streptomyces sp. NPDC006512 TaxID=3154307 RepID=UPI0033AECBAA